MKTHLIASIAALLMVVVPRASVAEVGYEDGQIAPTDFASRLAYYQAHARIRLGAERRLSNGISWRLFTDIGSGLALPRITWMPSAQRRQIANRLLDIVQGDMLMNASKQKVWHAEIDKTRRQFREPPLFEDGIDVIQTEVDLTYAGNRLMSIIDLGYDVPEGNGIPRIIRGLTFDLERAEIYRVTECAGSKEPYGTFDNGDANYLFQFGELLKICDRTTYERFIGLVDKHTKIAALRILVPGEKSIECITHYPNDGPVANASEKGEIVLYLTFSGLAVHNTSFAPSSRRHSCTLERNVHNPIIIPYRDLEPFMQPGPWRDELLKLR